MLMSSMEDSGAGGHEPQDVASMVKDALGILRRRYLMFSVVTAAIFALFVIWLLQMTPMYMATARVRIDPKPIAASGTLDQSPSLPDQSIVDTEINVVKSRDIAAAVVDQLKLTRNPEFTEGLNDKDNPVSPAERLEIVIARVMGGLKVEREKSTYLFDVTYKSKNPTTAAAVANAFAQNYIRFTVQRRTGTATQQYEWLDKRLANLSTQAKAADAALAQYQAANGLTTSGMTASTITDQQIAPLSSQLASAQATAAAARSDLNVAQAQMASGGATAASSVLNSPAIAALRQNRAATQQQLSQLATRYGPKHPQTIQAQQQLAAIDQQIQDEAHRIVGELQARARAADAQAGSLSGDLSRLRGEQASNARSAVPADALRRDAEAKHNAYNQLAAVTQQVDQLAENSLSQAQIIESAQPPLGPSSPKTKMILAGGLLVALICGFGIVTVQELLSSTFKRTEDVERVLGLPFLASVPLVGAKAGKPTDTLVDRPMSAFAEAFRAVRGSLSPITGDAPRVVAMVSTLPGEGKTTSALALARIMAMSGERTVLVDCDMRRSGLSSLVQLDSRVGLLDVLRDDADLEGAISRDQVPGLDVIGNLRGSFEATDLFGSGRMADLLAVLRQRYDRVILDTPPLLGVADARAVAARVDAVVLVVRWDHSVRNAVKSAVKWLRHDHAPIAGAVLTMVNPRSEAFGALYYSRAYANYYQPA